jgi:hypothetical protein
MADLIISNLANGAAFSFDLREIPLKIGSIILLILKGD